MQEIKKVNIKDVLNDDEIIMRFDENPNIPSIKCSENTYELIKNKLIKKAKADKLQKLIDTELKVEEKEKTDGSQFGMMFSFGDM